MQGDMMAQLSSALMGKPKMSNDLFSPAGAARPAVYMPRADIPAGAARPEVKMPWSMADMGKEGNLFAPPDRPQALMPMPHVMEPEGGWQTLPMPLPALPEGLQMEDVIASLGSGIQGGGAPQQATYPQPGQGMPNVKPIQGWYPKPLSPEAIKWANHVKGLYNGNSSR